MDNENLGGPSREFPVRSEQTVDAPRWIETLDNQTMVMFIEDLSQTGDLNANQQNLIRLVARLHEIVSITRSADHTLPDDVRDVYATKVGELVTDNYGGLLVYVTHLIEEIDETDFNKVLLKDRLRKDHLTYTSKMQHRRTGFRSAWDALDEFIDLKENRAIPMLIQMPWMLNKLNSVELQQWQSLGEKFFFDLNNEAAGRNRGRELLNLIRDEYRSYDYPTIDPLRDLLID